MARLHAQHVKNVVSFVVSRVLSLLLYVAPVPFFISRQGDAAYGILTLAMLVFAYLHVFDLGVGYAVNQRFSRALARGNPRALDVVRAAVPLYFVCAVLVGGVFLVLPVHLSSLAFGTPAYAGTLRILSACVLFLMLSALTNAVLQAYNKVNWMNYSRLLLDGGKALGLLVGGLMHDGVAGVFWVVLGSAVLKTCLDIALAVRCVGSTLVLMPRWHWRELRINIVFGMPMLMSTGLGMVLTLADKLFVSHFLGHQALAYYAIATDLCGKAYVLVWALSGSLYTVLLRRRATGRVVDGLFRLSILVVVGIAGVFYLPLALLAHPLLALWIGADFARHAAAAVPFCAAAAVGYLLTSVYYNFMQAAGAPKALLICCLLAVIVMFLGLWYVSRAPRIESVAVVMLVTFMAQAVFMALAKRFVLPRRPATTLLSTAGVR